MYKVLKMVMVERKLLRPIWSKVQRKRPHHFPEVLFLQISGIEDACKTTPRHTRMLSVSMHLLGS